jgi:beta-1,4-mannosyl-glycoprotein beta-1,4-N-acetylglucosaminyltransferase
LELLELRLSELEDVVDHHVLVELPMTFRGEGKPLHYLNNRGRFTRWNHKIIHITPAVYPVGPHPTTDWFQRRQIGQGFGSALPEDLLVIGDVDEIPNRTVIAELKAKPKTHPVAMVQKLYYHKVNMLSPTPWVGTVIMPRGMKEIDCQKIRDDRYFFPRVENGGWHLTWLGDGKRILKKLNDLDCEKENAIYPPKQPLVMPPHDAEVLDRMSRSGEDLFGRKDRAFQRTVVPIQAGTMHPFEIDRWLSSYPEYVL